MKERDLHVKVMKAGRNLRLPKAEILQNGEYSPTKIHLDKAAEWVVPQAIRIHSVSIPEQSEVSIYADIEVSKAQEMYMEKGHIFRVKYAGPSIQRHPPAAVYFSGSNITTTNIVFPRGISIPISHGESIFVHLDIVNHSPYDVDPMAQDVYLYYSFERKKSLR
jgi:hypothetical protein